MTEKVSVLMTVRNGAPWISNALLALSEQIRKPDEVIVVDDNSDDNSVHIATDFKDFLPLNIVRTPRAGRANALNFGVSIASCGLVALNDVDDISLPSRFETCLKVAAERPSAVAIGASHIEINGDLSDLSTQVSANRRIRVVNRFRSSLGMPFVHSSLVFRKEAWQKSSGYSNSLECAIDYDFVLGLHRHGEVVVIGEPLVAILVNPNSHFRSLPQASYEESVLKALERRRPLGWLTGLAKSVWTTRFQLAERSDA